MTNSVIIFLVAVLIVAAMFFVILFLTKKSARPLKREKYQSRWLKIESSLKRDNDASHSMAILNADKLLDQALRDRGFKGKTMGERLKAADKEWSKSDHVWAAHKIRNKLAHEPDVKVSYEIAARTLVAFKRALKDLGAI